jgi:hypothetical protein
MGKPEEPLIPMDEFKKIVARLAQVPKHRVTAQPAKPPRKKAAAKPRKRRT